MNKIADTVMMWMLFIALMMISYRLSTIATVLEDIYKGMF